MLKKIILKITNGNTRSVAVKKNILYSLIIKGLSIIVSLLLVPITLDYVSSELYGIWLTLSSIIVWVNFFDVGFTLGLKNKLAEAIATKDWVRGKSLVSTTYYMMVMIFIPLCIVLEFIVPCIDWSSFLNVSQDYNISIRNAMYVLVACFCLQMIVNVLTSVIAAFQKVALSSLFPVIGNILSLLVIYILTKTFPSSLTALAYAISLMPVIVVAVASFLLYGNHFKKVSPSYSAIDRRHLKELFGLGIKFFLIQIQVVILFQCTNILISNVSGPEDVTAYNIAYKYLGVAMMLFNIILSPIWPAFTDAYTKNDRTWMIQIYKKLIKIYLFSVGMILVMLMISPIVYNLWIGKKAIIPHSMTIYVAIYMILTCWDSLQIMMINGVGKIKLQTYVTFLGLIMHIPLSFIFGKYIGAQGVVLSKIIITLIYSSFFTIQINRILKGTAKGIWNQ